MVVIIEDITDQENQKAEIEETKQVAEECGNPQGAQDVSEEPNGSGSWVEVNNESSGDAEDNLEDDQNVADEDAVDPEVFAEQLARADALKAEGNTAFADGDMEQAIAKYSEALEEAPMTAPLQRAVYFANRAACHMRLEEHSEAAIDCSAAIELHPEYTKALIRRAGAFEAMADYEAALMDLKKVLELEPKNTAAIAAQKRIEPLAEKKREEVKDEMIGKLKDLGNSLLGKFGMSLDNFKTEQDPNTGSYSIKFQQ